MKQQKVILLALISSALCVKTYAQLKVTSLNNVGIGATTTLSNVKFQVIGNSIFSGSGTVTSAAYIRGNSVSSGSTTPDYTWYGDDQTGLFHPAAWQIGFAIGGTEKMRLDYNGYLGIGTSSPSKPLDVATSGGIRISQAAFASSTNEIFFQDNGQIRSVDDNHRIIFDRANNIIELREYGDLIFSPGATSGTRTQKVTFKTDGKVGIGQTAPTQLLDVNGNAIIEGSNKLYVSNTNKYLGNCYNSDFGLISNNSTWLRIGSNNGIAFWGQTGAEGNTVTSNMFINQYGVGINGGTAGTTYALEVTGSAHASGSWIGSDKRYKQNIKSIDKALDKVLKIKGASYDFNTAEYSYLRAGKNLGFIAQELQEILPEAVMQDEKGFYSVNYDAVIPVLVEAIKEQNKTIENLQQKTESLTSDLNSCCNATKTSENIPNANMSSLSQNIPNPFSENTEINYNLIDGVQKGVLYVFDMQGNMLKTFDNLKAGNGKIQINGGEFKPGMYLYSLIADGKEIDTKRMILTNK